MVLSGLGELAVRQGDYRRATSLLEEGLALRREIGYQWGIAASLGTLGWASLRQGDLKKAVSQLVESLTLRRDIRDRAGGIAWCLEKLAEIALTKGQSQPEPRQDKDFQRAARLFGAAVAIRKPIGSLIDLVDQPEYERQLAIVRTQLGTAQFEAAWAEGQVMTLHYAIDYALAVEPDQIGMHTDLVLTNGLAERSSGVIINFGSTRSPVVRHGFHDALIQEVFPSIRIDNDSG